MNTKIYKVQLCDGGHNDYYYAASDVNAIFERKFNYKEKSVELLNDEFIGTFDESKQKLFYVSLTAGRSLYVIANDMKEAYNLLCDNIGDEDLEFKKGDRIAQGVLALSPKGIFNQVDDIMKIAGANRGGGYGSTGK